MAEGGFGAHIPVTSWFRINNELKASTIGNDSDEPVLNTGYSLIPSFRIRKHIELFRRGRHKHYMMTKDVSNSKNIPEPFLMEKRLGLPNCNNCISDTSLVYNIYSDSSIQYSLYSISPESTFDCRFRGFKKGLYLPRILKATILGTILKFVIA